MAPVHSRFQDRQTSGWLIENWGMMTHIPPGQPVTILVNSHYKLVEHPQGYICLRKQNKNNSLTIVDFFSQKSTFPYCCFWQSPIVLDVTIHHGVHMVVLDSRRCLSNSSFCSLISHNISISCEHRVDIFQLLYSFNVILQYRW